MEEFVLDGVQTPEARMIRTCHLITGLDVGGAEHALVRLCSALPAFGYEQLVLAMLPSGPLAADLSRAGIAARFLGMRRGWPGPAGVVRLVQELRRFQPDVLQTWMYHADLLGTIALPFIPRCRLVWNLRCSDMGSERRGSLRMLVKSLALVSRFPDAIVVNAESGKNDHVRMGYTPRRWVLIPNGVDTAKFRPRPGERAALRAALQLPAERPLIGMIARVHPQKDHRTFVSAARTFVTNMPSAHFVLAGTGCEPGSEPLTGMIRESGLASHVSLLGSRSDMPLVYPALDLVCLSSAFGEGTPNVLLEALSCGVPCVATDVGDSRRVIGSCGLIVPPGDPSAMAAAWGNVLRHDFSAAARSRAVTQFADDAVSAAYDQLYRGLLREPAPMTAIDYSSS